MNPPSDLFDQVAAFPNLLAAWGRARRGKGHRASVDRFHFRLEPELLRLRCALLEGTWRPGPFSAFEVRDPKPRVIHAAPFPDRVLHHALVGMLEPWFESWFDEDSFACRKGKGIDAALRRALHLCRKARWVLKTDIEKCYPSIPQDRLKALLAERFSDPRLLELLGRIIDHGGSKGRGLLIGNLTSQWLANLYLDQIDRYVRRELKPAGYIRYMDDFALFAKDRKALREMQDRLGRWVLEVLGLRLKKKVTQIHRAAAGFPFLGFRVAPRGLSVRRATWTRFRRRLGERWHWLCRGQITTEEFAARVQSLFAHLDRAATRGLRRKEVPATEI